jgi:hypothetical protein
MRAVMLASATTSVKRKHNFPAIEIKKRFSRRRLDDYPLSLCHFALNVKKVRVHSRQNGKGTRDNISREDTPQKNLFLETSTMPRVVFSLRLSRTEPSGVAHPLSPNFPHTSNHD